MKTDTPEGTLEISDDELVYTPKDGRAETRISLSPMPKVSYTRGLYGQGTLDVGEHSITLDNQQASIVVEELQRRSTSDGTSTTTKARTTKNTGGSEQTQTGTSRNGSEPMSSKSGPAASR